MMPQWKNKDWHNFWSRRDFNFFFNVILFEGVLVEKLKLHAFFGVQYRFKKFFAFIVIFSSVSSFAGVKTSTILQLSAFFL